MQDVPSELSEGWILADLGEVFAALADRSRRRVVSDLVADVEDRAHACGSFDLAVGKATRTHHFKVLREAGLIDQEFHGNGSSVRLRRREIERQWPGLLAVLAQETSEPEPG